MTDICIRHNSNDDDFLFDFVVQANFTSLRSKYSNHFNMKHNQWNDGWGWTSSNASPGRAFTKMLNACYLLEKGVAAYAENRRPNWSLIEVESSSTQNFQSPLSALTVREILWEETDEGALLEGVSAYVKMTHAFVTNQNEELFHFHDQIIGDTYGFSSQWVENNLTQSLADPTLGKIKAIVSSIDVPPFKFLENLSSFITSPGNYESHMAPYWNKNLRLWVFGRDHEGYLVIYHKLWYQPDQQWECFSFKLLTILPNLTHTGGLDEIPTVIKELKVVEGRFQDNQLIRLDKFHLHIDIFIRIGTELLHYRKYGDFTHNPREGWDVKRVQAEIRLPQGNIVNTEIHTRPVAIKVNNREIHVYARNQHGALLEFSRIQRRRKLFDLFRLPKITWTVRNIDNELAAADFEDVISYAPVDGEPVAILVNGSIQVFQRTSSPPYGLFQYLKRNNQWYRQFFGTGGPYPSNNVAITSEINLLQNEIPDFASHIPLFVNVFDADDRFLIYDACFFESIANYWLFQAVPSDGLRSIEDHTDPIDIHPGSKMVSCISKFEDWVEINIMTRKGSGRLIGRYSWVDRAGWYLNPPPLEPNSFMSEDICDAWLLEHSENLPSLGWFGEYIQDSTGDFEPAVNNMIRLMDVVSIDGSDILVNRLSRDRPWHHRRDYYKWASGSDYDFEYKPKNSQDHAGWARNFYFDIQIMCPGFDADTVVRAGIMLHEATHVNKNFRGSYYVYQHSDVGGENMDDWFDHGLWDIDPDKLRSDNSSHKHSMYQIQIEFLTDMGEFPAHNLPHVIWGSAIGQAQGKMHDHIITIPPWQPGEPRPLY